MKKIIKKTIYIIIIIFFSAVVLFLSLFLFLDNKYNNKVIPGTFFEGKNVSGMSLSEVNSEVEKIINSKNNQINLRYLDNEIKVNYTDLGFEFEKEKTVKDIFYYNNVNYLPEKFITILSSLIISKNIPINYKYDFSKTDNFLKELSILIDKDPVDGKFEIKNEKVIDFKIGSNGQKLVISENINLIKTALIEGDEYVDLRIDIVLAKGVEDMEKMGVKELIATGESNFSGSPKNRIHNINTGAQVFNGILIPPGESFSFINHLGEVNAKTGYLPELVIKEDKTIPEYGGGLCQVSTTFFRAAINAGLPISERTPHAYRVSYYEPAGFDAAIYQPKPDLVFKNDTEKYILIQTRIEGSKLLVDLYGTKDGRVVEVSKPNIYNYVQPGEPIMVETEELAPGEKKQIESSHIGADASFSRKITYSNGNIKEENFDSHYIPWRAKFLVGKELVKTEEEQNKDTANDNIETLADKESPKEE